MSCAGHKRRSVSPIRTLERQDLGEVARLHAGAGDGAPIPARWERLAAFFERTLLDHPWADAEIPSLVYEESGEILGFLGSNVRRMQFDGRAIRMACSAHLLTHPRVRNKATGALLLRRYLAGAQDLTITDGANETVRRMWEGLGGRTVHVSCLTFLRVLRPFGLATHRALSRRAAPAAERAVAPVARLLDLAATRLVDREGASETESEQLTPSGLLEQLPKVAEGLRLVPDYDVDYLTWLFAELDRVGDERVFRDRVARGPLVADLVIRDRRVMGWFVAQVKPGGLCRVLQVAAQPRQAGAVLDRLVRRADELGAVGVYGRLEPRLVGPLSERRTLLRFSDGRLLVHARDDDVTDSILRGDALLTRLDGEWW
jgi:hypothetical protein